MIVVDVADVDALGPRYRYRGKHVIQSLLMTSDESESSDSDVDSNISATENKSR